LARLVIAARASQDLLEIWRYIAEHGSDAAADRVLDRIYRSCAKLEAYPQLGRARPDIDTDARGLVVDRWLAFYRVVGDEAQILRVMHGARDLSDIDWPKE
jgi:toxin ParE1/3/4